MQFGDDGRLAKRRKQAEEREARFEDFIDLVKMGVDAETAAVRVGTNPQALSRLAYRWKRYDIAHAVDPAVRRLRQERRRAA